jgi:hypothetical protein
MSELPLYATAVVVGDVIRLRAYRGSKLALDLPLRRRQALILGAQLVNLALIATQDPLMLKPALEQRIAMTKD